MSQHTNPKPATMFVQNVGGIDTCEIEFNPGVTVSTGQNATNRTSLLTAIAGALGGSAATLKSDTDEGHVRLEFDGETYTRHYHRGSDGSVITDGEPYTDDPELVDLFACLLEDNPARRAVERGNDLRDVLMRPVDTATIQERVREFERERTQITTRLEEIKRERNRLPEFETRRTTLEDELETITEELRTLRERVANHDIDAEAAGTAEDLLSELESRRQTLRQTRDEIKTQQSTLEALYDEREGVSDELDDLKDQDTDWGNLERELGRLQDRERELQDSINDLSAIVEFNDELLTSSDELIDEDPDEQSVTDELDPMSATIKCWTCGSRVERRAIGSQLEELRRVIEDKRTERQDVQDEIAALREQLDRLQSAESRRRECERRLDEIDRQRQRREQRIDDLEKKATDLRETIRDLEEEVKETEEFRESELVEQYERLSELEYERGQIEQELNDAEDEIRELESLADEREQLEAQKAQIQEELGSLRTRIEDLERDAVEAFNEHMSEVLSLLEYRNIERVWIERKVPGDGPEGVFELHVVRSTENGTMYEDTVDHLSESEREVIGLVVALAGYLVHEVYETVPVMLLDSLEAIDADRIARLIDYIAEFASYLVVALLEEDAQGLNDTYTRLSSDAIGS